MPKVEEQKAYIGVDPGVNGGLAVIRGDDVTVSKMPKKLGDILNWFLEAGGYSLGVVEREDTYIAIEQLTGYVPATPGGEGSPGSHMLTLGRNLGNVEMACIAAGFLENHIDMPYSRHWHKVLDLGKLPKDYSEKKRYLKKIAENLFPNVKITLHTADALLLAHYCQVVFGGKECQKS